MGTWAEDWAEELRRAATEDDVVEMVNDQLASWTAWDLARIPEECRPIDVRTGAHVAYWAFQLGRSQFEVEERDRAQFQRMATLMELAAQRGSEILATLQELAAHDLIGEREILEEASRINAMRRARATIPGPAARGGRRS